MADLDTTVPDPPADQGNYITNSVGAIADVFQKDQPQLPSWDEAAAKADQPQSNSQVPTWDQAAQREEGNPQALTDAQRDFLMQKPYIGNTIKAFSDSASDGIFDEDTMKGLKDAGVADNYLNWHDITSKSLMDGTIIPAVQTLNSGIKAGVAQIALPLAGAANLAMNAVTEPFNLFSQGAEALGEATGHSKLGETVAIGPEALMDVEFAGIHAIHALPPEVAVPKANGILDGEENYFGLTEPTPVQKQAQQQAAEMYPDMMTVEVKPLGGPNIHDVARQIQPDTFSQYDQLSNTKDNLRAQLNDLTDARDQQHADLELTPEQIKDQQDILQTSIDTLNAKKKLNVSDQARLNDLQEQHQTLQEQYNYKSGTDTPEQADVRQKLQEADYAQRDLAPAVSQAYRDAQDRISNGEDFTQTDDQSVADETPVDQKPIEEQKSNIIADATQKFMAAGRPAEEANAAAQLEGARYETLAQQYPKFSAEDWYNKESANTVAGKERAKSPEMAQQTNGKFRPANDDAKSTITLFKSADASTLIHEKGHEWTEQLIRLAKDDDAPVQMKNDAKALKDWSGYSDKVPETTAEKSKQTKAQEKFARGFERYMMEGVAPSRELAGVFAKFKGWLTNIYKTIENLRSPISNDIRDIFDRLLSNNPEKTVIAPDHEPGKMLADIHEAENTPPEHADAVGDTVEKEIDQTARLHDPEIYDAIKSAEQTKNVTGQAASNTEPATANGSSTGDKVSPTEPSAVATGSGGTAPEGTDIRPATDDTSGDKSASVGPDTNPVQRRVPESSIVDKAGNIRLDNFKGDESIKEYARYLARTDDNFNAARGGIVTIDQRQRMSLALGLSPDKFDFKQPDGVSNSVWADAVQNMAFQSISDLTDSAQKYKETGDVDDLADFQEKESIALSISRYFSNVTAESGRTQQVFNKGNMKLLKTAAEKLEFLQKQSGFDSVELYQKRAEMLSSFDDNAKAAKFLQDSQKTTNLDKLIAYRDASILSGPVTHLHYVEGGLLNRLYKPAVVLASSLGGTTEAGEAGAMMAAFVPGAKNGFKVAASVWSKGEAADVFQGSYKPIEFDSTQGKALNKYAIQPILKSISSIHAFNQSIALQQEMAAAAYRMARSEKLETGTDDFNNRFSDLITNPTEGMIESATKIANKETYFSGIKKEGLLGDVTNFINKYAVGRLLFPFLRMTYNIKKQVVENTPLGIFSEDVRNNLFGDDKAARDLQIAKITAGTAFIGSTIAFSNNITGDGPTDPNQRKIWLLTHTPNSIQIGNLALPLKALGLPGQIMNMTANVRDGIHEFSEEQGSKAYLAVMNHLDKAMFEGTFIQDTQNLFDAIDSPTAGKKYIENFAKQFVPYSTALNQGSRYFDTTKRSVNSVPQALESEIPSLHESLYPMNDVFGQPITTDRWLNNSSNDVYGNDPVVQKMNQLNIGMSMPKKDILGVPLNDQQYYDYSKLAGRLAKIRLNNLVANPSFNNVPIPAQIKSINAVITGARKDATTPMLMQNNMKIAKQAQINKAKAAGFSK